MGIKLDWQVESEQTQTRATEDLATRQRRRRTQRRFLLLIGLLVCILGSVVIAAVWRLRDIDHRLRQDLIDTVQAEVTALRVGDFANYMAIQRSASDAFITEQTRAYEDYQVLKQANRVRLTGEIVDITIDDQRGRVIVQEEIDGVPHHVLWFYWYYEDGGSNDQSGWRHVPDDLTFWGNERELETERVRVTYRELDEAFARALADRIDAWIAEGCALLACASPPPQITINVVAEQSARIEWAAADYWTLVITSPLVERARADVLLDPAREALIAEDIARRLVALATNFTPPPATADSAWFQDELARWLGNRLRAAPSGGFMDSLIALSGPTAPQNALATLIQVGAKPMPPTLDDILITFMGNPMPLLPVEQLSALDWADFFQWRLELEHDLLVQPDAHTSYLGLYDQEDVYAAGEAVRRLEDPAYISQPVPQVQNVAITRDEQSQTYAYVEVTITQDGFTTTNTIIWRLAGGTWKRRS